MPNCFVSIGCFIVLVILKQFQKKKLHQTQKKSKPVNWHRSKSKNVSENQWVHLKLTYSLLLIHSLKITIINYWFLLWQVFSFFALASNIIRVEEYASEICLLAVVNLSLRLFALEQMKMFCCRTQMLSAWIIKMFMNTILPEHWYLLRLSANVEISVGFTCSTKIAWDESEVFFYHPISNWVSLV